MRVLDASGQANVVAFILFFFPAGGRPDGAGPGVPARIFGGPGERAWGPRRGASGAPPGWAPASRGPRGGARGPWPQGPRVALVLVVQKFNAEKIGACGGLLIPIDFFIELRFGVFGELVHSNLRLTFPMGLDRGCPRRRGGLGWAGAPAGPMGGARLLSAEVQC